MTHNLPVVLIVVVFVALVALHANASPAAPGAENPIRSPTLVVASSSALSRAPWACYLYFISFSFRVVFFFSERDSFV